MPSWLEGLLLTKHSTFDEGMNLLSRISFAAAINSYIRDGRILNAEDLSKETGINFRVFELWELVANAKQILLNRFISSEDVECFVNDRPVNHEGIVVINIPNVTYIKLVDRYEFSRANFNNKKFANAV